VPTNHRELHGSPCATLSGPVVGGHGTRQRAAGDGDGDGDNGGPLRAALATAQWSGLALVTVEVVTGKAQQNGATVTQPVVIRDRAGKTVATTTFVWVQRGGVFLLSNWPRLAAAT